VVIPRISPTTYPVPAVVTVGVPDNFPEEIVIVATAPVPDPVIE
jgi:hypothetical protein